MTRNKPGRTYRQAAFASIAVLVLTFAPTASALASGQARDAQAPPNIFQATLQESKQKTAEISTEELRRILAEKSAVVLDARSPREYAMGHIPSALNVGAKTGVSLAQYVSDVAEVGRLLNDDKAAALVRKRSRMRHSKTSPSMAVRSIT